LILARCLAPRWASTESSTCCRARRAASSTATSIPPYDIERTGQDAYRITLAVAGFREDELTITAERNLLFIEGEHRQAEASGPEREFLHRGIGARAFKQRFQLADHVKVTDANLTDGLLTIDLVREIPEVMRPRRIEVGRKPAQAEPQQIEGQRAA